MRISARTRRRRGRRRRPGAAGGFTLVEVLIASAAAMLIVLSGVAALTAGFRVFSSVSNPAHEPLLTLHSLLETLEQDAASVAAMCADTAPFHGDESGWEGVRLRSAYQTAASIEPVRVRWALSGGALERTLFRPGEEQPFQTSRWVLPAAAHFDYAWRAASADEDAPGGGAAAAVAGAAAPGSAGSTAAATAASGAGAATPQTARPPLAPLQWGPAWTQRGLPLAIRFTCGETVLEVARMVAEPDPHKGGRR